MLRRFALHWQHKRSRTPIGAAQYFKIRRALYEDSPAGGFGVFGKLRITRCGAKQGSGIETFN